MIFDIHNPMSPLGLMSGRAQTRRAWILPLIPFNGINKVALTGLISRKSRDSLRDDDQLGAADVEAFKQEMIQGGLNTNRNRANLGAIRKLNPLIGRAGREVRMQLLRPTYGQRCILATECESPPRIAGPQKIKP